jgi:DNA-binding CsgD family transcriptional regulator
MAARSGDTKKASADSKVSRLPLLGASSTLSKADAVAYWTAKPGTLLGAIGIDTARAAEPLHALQPFDFACFGVAQVVGDGVRIDDARLVHGELLEHKAQLLQRLTLLVAAWTTMRSTIVLDLGPCVCIGSRLVGKAHAGRLFAIDAQPLGGQHIVFVAVSSVRWQFERVNKESLRAVLAASMSGVDALRAQGVLDGVASAAPEAGASLSLSPRQADIVRLIAAGCTNKEIAQQLGLSPFTVRNQISLMSAKTGRRRRSQLTSLLYRLNDAVVGSLK